MTSASIRTYLLLLVLAVAFPLAAVVGYNIYADTRQAIDHTKTQLRTLASMMVSSTGSRIAGARKILERLAARPLVKKLEAKNCDAALNELHALDLGYSNIVVTDLAGLTICSAVRLAGGKTVSVGHFPWFQHFLKERRFTVGQPHIGPITGKWVSVLSAPIWNERQEMIGAVHLPLDLKTMDPHIPAQFLSTASRYGFFAADGTMIWRNLDPEGVIATRPGAEAAQRIVATRDGEVEGRAVDGVIRYFSVMPIAETDWIAFVGVPLTEIYAEAKRRAVTQVALILVLIGGLALLAVAIARRIARPMAALAQTARAVHDGDYRVRARPSGPREIAVVAREFNVMIDAQQRHEEQLRAFMDNSAVVAWLKDEAGRFVFVSDNFLKRFGVTREAVLGHSGHEIWPDRTQDEFQREDQAVRDYGTPVEIVQPAHNPDGSISWWLANRFSFRDSTGRRLLGAMGVDISALKKAELELRLAASVFASSLEGIMIADAHNIIIDVNPAFTHITGYSRDEIIGQSPRMLASGRQDPEFYAALWQCLREKAYWQGEIWNRRKNGEIYPEMLSITAVRDEAGQLQHYIGVFSDLSQIKAHEVEVNRITHFDSLTGAPNRRLLADHLGLAIAHARRSGKPMAVCSLDLDGFKAVNDQFGHGAGDSILIEITGRLRNILRADDTLARLGGDEFVMLLTDLPRTEERYLVFDRVLAAIGAPLQIGPASLRVSASIGVTLFPDDDSDNDTLLRHADQAMVRAKEAGKNRYHFFDPAQDRQRRDHHHQLDRLGQALQDGEFILYYQPKVDLVSGAVIGAEALIRWQHPEQGLLPPAAFLHHIEGSELESAVGEWVIDTVLRQIEIWQAAGTRLVVSANISASHLLRADFAERLGLALARHPSVSPGDLELEILETAALGDMEQAIATLAACRQLEVRFALDDFGTGYSSLAYFRSLPVDILKIDQSFVRGMLDNADDFNIVDSVVRLAHAFNRPVIAEGVETLAHGARLIQLGCRLAQGYGIARPMPAAGLPDWIVHWRTAAAWLTLEDSGASGET